MMNDRPMIAIGKTFLKAMGDLPKNAQNQVRTFLDKFEKNPASGAIHKEGLHNTRGAKLYSARININYRVILAYDDVSQVYLLLYVGAHEDAYNWASRKCVDINSTTNAVQLYDVVDAGTMQAAPAAHSYASHVPDYEPQAQTSSTDYAATESRIVIEQEDIDWSNRKAQEPLPEEFNRLTVSDLRAFGVPDLWQELVLQMKTYGQLQEYMDQLPEDCTPYLQLIAEGDSIKDVLDLAVDAQHSSPYVGLDKTAAAESVLQPGDQQLPAQEDYRKALASYASQENFVIVEGEDDLRRLLDAPLEQWRVFLHPSQRQYVEHDYKGSYRLTGGAGTGKTVVAMHRAKQLAANLVRRHSAHKVLLTTFSKTLATDISANLRLICTAEEIKKIDVLNLDKYVAERLRAREFAHQLTYDDDIINGSWKRAVVESAQTQWSGDVPFLRDEWEQVIQAGGIKTLEEYFRSSRRGRGRRMSRAQKASLWKVAEAYLRIMSEQQKWDIGRAMNMVEDALRTGKMATPYAHIIVDEGQDFTASGYRMLRAMVPEGPNDLFIVGDAQQRIYGKTVVLSKCGIAIQGRSRRLKINYRTTEQIRDAAERVFDASGTNVAAEAFKALHHELADNDREQFDDLNGELIPSDDSHSLMQGPAPLAEQFGTRQEEFDAVLGWIDGVCNQQDADSGENEDGQIDEQYERNICIVTPSNHLCGQWAEYFERKGIEYYRLGNDAEDLGEPGVRIATMHRVKGLEFDAVAVVDVNSDTVPPTVALESTSGDKVAVRELCKQYRSLLYVSLTRARKRAYMVGIK